MWGWNPAEMRDGTNTEFFIKKARENGAKVICIDPRMSMSAVALADEWIPIRPGTDVAMMSAMAYTIITENMHDKDFIRRCCVGFDKTQMPEGCEDEESYSDYILGTHDGIPKTPNGQKKYAVWKQQPFAGLPVIMLPKNLLYFTRAMECNAGLMANRW
jgi:anaerobic dimethyl sulfoxide reductase subunit A